MSGAAWARRLWRRLWTTAAWLTPLGFLAFGYFFPLATILRTGFAPAGAFTPGPVVAVLAQPSTWGLAAFTFGQAALSTALTLAAGLPGAYLIARYRFPGRDLLRALSGVPFVLPTLVVAAAFNTLLGPRGWLNLALMTALRLEAPPLALDHSLTAILLAHVFYNTTIVLRLVGDFWAHLDPRLTAAARTLGASRWRAFTHITVPLLRPALLSAALLVFIFDFSSFGVILVLGGPRFATLEVEIYRQALNLLNLPAAAALTLLQLACTLALTGLSTRLAARAVPLRLRPRALTQRPLRTWRARLAAGLIVGGLVALLIAPLAALAARSLVRLEIDRADRTPAAPGVTLDFYQELFINRRNSAFYAPPFTAILNSLKVAGLTTGLALALGLPTALTLLRATRLSRWLEALVWLPLGTSAVTLGLGFLLAFSRPPFAWRTSPLLLPLAHTLIAFPFVVRSLLPALRSIRPELRRAAASLGASPAQVIRAVDLPLIARALAVAGAFAFAISLGEFGATALLTRPDFPTIPVVIYTFLGLPGALNYGQALALSTLLMIVCAGSLLAIESQRLGGGEF